MAEQTNFMPYHPLPMLCWEKEGKFVACQSDHSEAEAYYFEPGMEQTADSERLSQFSAFCTHLASGLLGMKAFRLDDGRTE